MLKQLKPQRSFGDSSLSCGLIKDLKTRYWTKFTINAKRCCGLIKDLKTRYSKRCINGSTSGCGLIKDLKTRYLQHMK